MALIIAALVLAGCSVYRRTTEPLTKEFNCTPVGTKSCEVREFRIKEPISGYGVNAEWGRTFFNEAAREAGMTNVYYADIETLTIMGVYRRKQMILYGD